ncbi:unnamed protein product, partial [Didymodactylos carnosus]
AYLNINDAVKLLIHSDPSIINNASNETIQIKHNMDGTTIGTTTNILMSTIACIESGPNKQSALNVIPLGQFKFNKESRCEIDRVIPDEFINMMEKKLLCLKNLKLELDVHMSIDMKMMWQVMRLYGITGQNKHKCSHCTASNMAELGKYSAFDPSKGARTLDQQYEELVKSKPRFGYQHQPIFHRKLDYKKMKLRIADVLLAEIISLISTTTTLAERNQHLQNVLTFLRQRAKDKSQIYINKKNEIEAPGRLNVNMHERFLRDIPLYAIMNDNHKAFFIKKLCGDLFDIMNLYNISCIYQHVKKESINWCERYKNLFGADAVTIYSHVLDNHAFEFHQEYDNLGLYTLQDNEKFNDVTTIDFFMSTNKRNFNVQLLQKRVRLRLVDIGLKPQGALALNKLFSNWMIKDTVSAISAI